MEKTSFNKASRTRCTNEPQRTVSTSSVPVESVSKDSQKVALGVDLCKGLNDSRKSKSHAASAKPFVLSQASQKTFSNKASHENLTNKERACSLDDFTINTESQSGESDIKFANKDDMDIWNDISINTEGELLSIEELREERATISQQGCSFEQVSSADQINLDSVYCLQVPQVASYDSFVGASRSVFLKPESSNRKISDDIENFISLIGETPTSILTNDRKPSANIDPINLAKKLRDFAQSHSNCDTLEKFINELSLSSDSEMIACVRFYNAQTKRMNAIEKSELRSSNVDYRLDDEQKLDIKTLCDTVQKTILELQERNSESYEGPSAIYNSVVEPFFVGAQRELRNVYLISQQTPSRFQGAEKSLDSFINNFDRNIGVYESMQPFLLPLLDACKYMREQITEIIKPSS